MSISSPGPTLDTAAAWLERNRAGRFVGQGCRALITEKHCAERRAWDTWGCAGCDRAPEIPEKRTPWCRTCGEHPVYGGHGKCARCAARTYRRGHGSPKRHPEPEEEVETMASNKGTCKQCNRGPLTLPGRGLCGKCYTKVLAAEKSGPADLTPAETPSGEEQAPGVLRKANGTRQAVAADPDGAPFLSIRFEPDDVQLLEALEEDARANRRSADQHLLWMLERVLEAGTRNLGA